MIRYYIIKLKNHKFDDRLISFFNSFLNEETLTLIKDDLAIIPSENNLNIVFDSILKNIEFDFSVKLNIMFAHKYFSYYDLLLNESFKYFNNDVFSLYEFLLCLNLNENRNMNNLIINEFKNVNPVLIDTCEMYLKCNKNALETAQKIRIHRNTLNQRMSKFIEITNLDIRDFYNASYFFLYLKIREMYICAWCTYNLFEGIFIIILTK